MCFLCYVENEESTRFITSSQRQPSARTNSHQYTRYGRASFWREEICNIFPRAEYIHVSCLYCWTKIFLFKAVERPVTIVECKFLSTAYQTRWLQFGKAGENLFQYFQSLCSQQCSFVHLQGTHQRVMELVSELFKGIACAQEFLDSPEIFRNHFRQRPCAMQTGWGENSSCRESKIELLFSYWTIRHL